jgi:hypothetical protein
MDSETLSSMDKPMDQKWEQFTVIVLEAAWQSARPIFFDLTFVLEMDSLLDSKGAYASSITAFELRYLQKHWNRFRAIVRFYRNDEETIAPS